MKANQAFRQDDEAVSPVIGVILMVAITVVLAAVVFVLVTRLSGDQSQVAPTLGFQVDNAAKRVSVVQVPAGQDWNDYRATVTCSAGNAALYRNEGTTGTNLLSGAAASESEDPVAADGTTINVGDYFTLACSTVTAGTTVELILTHKPSGTQVGTTWKFVY